VVHWALGFESQSEGGAAAPPYRIPRFGDKLLVGLSFKWTIFVDSPGQKGGLGSWNGTGYKLTRRPMSGKVLVA